MKHLVAAALIALTPAVVQADEITDTLNSAIKAYEDGDIQYALEELAYAQQQLKALKTADLAAFLPEVEGWTREVETDMNTGMAMMGGGVGAQADYSKGGDTVTLTFMADNPMVMGFAGIINNAAMMGMKITRVGRQKFVDQDGDMTALVGNRILVQADGAAPEVMLPILEAIDFEALAGFGQ